VQQQQQPKLQQHHNQNFKISLSLCASPATIMQVSTTNQKLQVLGAALQSLTKAQAEILPVSPNCCSQEILSHNLTCQDAFDSAYLFQRMPSFLVSNKENWRDRQYLSVIAAAITAAAKKQVAIQICIP
jgi:hypothetical protein